MSDPASIRIMIVDDHAVVRSGYRRLLENEPDILVVAEADTGDAAYMRYRRSDIDVCIIDIMMPGSSGIDAIRRIRAVDADARILVFTMYSRAAIARQALAAGATAFLSKDSHPSEMVHAVRAVAAGKPYLSHSLALELTIPSTRGAVGAFDALSPREFEVCSMYLRGARIDDIGENLKISAKTVSNLLSIVRQKLRVDTDIALFRQAAEAGLLEPAEPPAAVRDTPSSQ
ncbi:MAG: response regulator transcription factor [Burkholderiaceae bacterium]